MNEKRHSARNWRNSAAWGNRELLLARGLRRALAQQSGYVGLGRYSQSAVLSDEAGWDGVFAACRMASTFARAGAKEQTGSVAEASPASSRAWQRQPPKSCSRRSQVLQGPCIQSSPRNFWKAAEVSQISRRLRSFTLSKCNPGIICAAWQGRASPVGVMSISLRPQPPMQGLGYLA